MLKTYLTLFGFTLLGITLISNNSGVTTVQAKDRTGSPVGLTQKCEQCHAGASFSVNIVNRMKDSSGNVVTSYIPGAAYTYEVELTSTGASAFGFQTVGLISSTNANAGNLTALSSNCKIVTLTGRKYGEHVSRSNPGLFQMTWVAPVAGSGTVKFYASGIGCNSNSGTSGDKAVLGSALTLTEQLTSSIVQQEMASINIYPNPAHTFIKASLEPFETYKFILTSMDGKIVEVTNITAEASGETKISVADLENGLFLLTILDKDGKQLITKRFLKQ